MPEIEPSFILCHARSGSTLLRYLLDAHPDVACPAETTIPMICISVPPLVDQLLEGQPGSAEADSRPPPTPRAAREARAIVDRVMDDYLGKRGKSRWCDKSLITMMALDQVTAVFPDARYVCLYRHPMDFIASGLEAIRWGVAGYGFEAYTRMSPENFVAALADYWVDRTRMLLAFEHSSRYPTRRVYYENLSLSTREVLRDLLDFLGADNSPAVLDTIMASALTQEHEAGSGDYKVDFTNSVSRSSVGRGRTIPADKLQGPRRTRLNKILSELGYAPVDDDWNTGPGGVFSAANEAAGDELEAGLRTALTGMIQRRLENYAGACGEDFTIVVVPAAGPWHEWHIDATDRSVHYLGGGAPTSRELRFVLRLETLRSLLGGSLTMSEAMPVNLVRASKQGSEVPGSGQETRLLAHLLRPFTVQSAADER